MTNATPPGEPPSGRRPFLDPLITEEFRRAVTELLAVPDDTAQNTEKQDKAPVSPTVAFTAPPVPPLAMEPPPAVASNPVPAGEAPVEPPVVRKEVASVKPAVTPSPAVERPVRLTGPGLIGNELPDEPWEPSERPQWFERWRRGWRLATVIVILLGSYVAWRGRRDYQSFKHWRARSMAGEALKLAKEQNFAGAQELLDRAATLAPQEPDVMRAIIEFCEPRRDFMALYALRQLILTGAAETSDWELLCRLSFEWGRPELAPASLLREWSLAPAASLTPGQVLLSCQWLAGKGRVADAEKRIREKNGETTGGYPRLNLALANILMAGSDGDQKRLSEGIEILRTMSGNAAMNVTDRGDAAKMLSSYLLQQPNRELLKDKQARDLIRVFTDLAIAEPALALRHELGAASLKLAGQSSPVREVIDPLLLKAPSLPLPDRLTLARWLTDQRLFPDVRVLMSRIPEATTDTDWLELHLDALIALKNGPEAQALLAASTQVLSAVPRRVYAYRIARATGGDEEARKRLCQEILSDADDGAEISVLMDAAAVMERYQEWETAVNLYHRAEKDERNGLPARLAIVRCLNADPAVAPETLIGALESVLRLWPHLDDARNDLIYLKLIQDTADPAEMRAAKDGAEVYPWVLAYRMTAALAEFRSGQITGALALLEKEPLPWAQVQPGWQAVYAAVLAANSRIDEARAVSVRIMGTRLRPGEVKLLRQYVPETL